jgi:hypothetical protein
MDNTVCMRRNYCTGLLILGVVLVGASAAAYAQDAPLKSPGSAQTVGLPAVNSSSDTVVEGVPSSSAGEPDYISPEVIERVRQRIRARASVADGSPGMSHNVGTRQHASAVAVNLPLPNTVIARTIERIGYTCGEVASAAPLGSGEPGVFKVTCTSGQSYQARPVHGRYHFRRWSMRSVP